MKKLFYLLEPNILAHYTEAEGIILKKMNF